MARRRLLIALACHAVLLSGCSALGLFDRTPARACVSEVQCQAAELRTDPCVTYHCDPDAHLCFADLVDADRDGAGALGCATSAYATPGTATDCNDADPTVHVAAVEVCGGTDNDCDGAIDEACVTARVATGQDHTCYLAGPTLLCWGSNLHGQIGIGSADIVGPHPRRVDIDDAIAIAVGQWTTCATRADGRVFCWGNATAGELALPTVPSRRVSPTEVPALEGATSLTLGEGYGCALFGDEPRCWGTNLFDVFGGAMPSESTTPVPIPGVHATQIDAGGAAACAVLLDGTVTCWGTGFPAQARDATCGDGTGAPCPIPTVDHAITLEVGGTHACARTEAEGVVCWGNNATGGLGTDTALVGGVFAPPLAQVSAVSTGGQHTCAVSAGRLWCWGSNRQFEGGQVTRGDLTQPTPVLEHALRFVSVAAGTSHTCATRDTGSVLCWGSNIAGQLGVDAAGETSDPVEPLVQWGADGSP